MVKITTADGPSNVDTGEKQGKWCHPGGRTEVVTSTERGKKDDGEWVSRSNWRQSESISQSRETTTTDPEESHFYGSLRRSREEGRATTPHTRDPYG